jgi:hypothetical protein
MPIFKLDRQYGSQELDESESPASLKEKPANNQLKIRVSSKDKALSFHN